MCGITGWIDWERDLTQDHAAISRMTETLANRGPDASGIWACNRAALGHRRLVVVDPEGGNQPMTRVREGKTYTVVYNGELYNTIELRRELESRGCLFRTRNSDTEVLLLAYMEWGERCVDRFNGIFAFAVWDDGSQKLFMSRDRLGVKPLFYAENGDSFLFGSELKALLAHPSVPPEVDRQDLAQIFLLAPSRIPGSGVFKRVRELKPGCSLVHSRNGTGVSRYWQLSYRDHRDDLGATAERVRSLFQDAVARQLVSDVPVCAFLSGGLDSSAIVAFAAGALNNSGRGPLHTYQVDHQGNDRYFRPNPFEPNPDADYVQMVSREFGTVHHRVEVSNEDLAGFLDAAMQANDLPGYGDIDSSLYYFCRSVKENATVALSGESADEIFGGYPWFSTIDPWTLKTFPWMLKVKERGRIMSPELASMVHPETFVEDRYRQTLAQAPLEGIEDPLEARVRAHFYLNMNWFMATLLSRKDRISMASGLEVRVPFCDHRLVEYAWNIPWRMKNLDGREKGILRKALEGLLPNEILLRKKSPYPKTHNPGYQFLVRSRLQRILDDPASPLLDYIDESYVREAVGRGAAEFSPSWYGQLMGPAQLYAFLIQVNTWLGQYKITVQ